MFKTSLRMFALTAVLFGFAECLLAQVTVVARAVHSDGFIVKTYGGNFDDGSTWGAFAHSICSKMGLVGRASFDDGSSAIAYPFVRLKGNVELGDATTLKDALESNSKNDILEVEITGTLVDFLKD
jgi:hypothetical protein